LTVHFFNDISRPDASDVSWAAWFHRRYDNPLALLKLEAAADLG